MVDLIDVCRAATGRTYPPGYGFALGYLTEDPGVECFKAMREAALDALPRRVKVGDDDAVAFARVYAESVQTHPNKGWPWWLIEAAQLVHADALAGNAQSERVLEQWDHPGFPRPARAA